MTWEALSTRLAQWPGYRLLTVMAYGEGTSRRLWSSNPDIWPTGGEKPLPPSSELYRTVAVLGRPRWVNGRDAIQAAFADHALILAAGCECAINVPVCWQGRTVGALNLLDAADRYAGIDMDRLTTMADSMAHLLRMQT